MIESKSYFETYIHYLQCFQKLNSEQLPFRKYIIDAEQNVDFPHYLNYAYPIYQINLNFNKTQIESAIDQVNVKSNDWKILQKHTLDASQLQALKAVLQNEIALIQGPPGTGKTYVGALGVKLLLDNKQLWKKINSDGPILIVCYTNHALDQFLIHIKNFTHSIVRIGGRCQTEELRPYQLANQRENIRRTTTFFQLRDRLKNIQEYLEELTSKLLFTEEVDWKDFKNNSNQYFDPKKLFTQHFEQFYQIKFTKALSRSSIEKIFMNWQNPENQNWGLVIIQYETQYEQNPIQMINQQIYQNKYQAEDEYLEKNIQLNFNPAIQKNKKSEDEYSELSVNSDEQLSDQIEDEFEEENRILEAQMFEDFELGIDTKFDNARDMIDQQKQLRNMSMLFDTSQNEQKFFKLVQDLQLNKLNLFTLTKIQKQFLQNFISIQNRNELLPVFEELYQKYLELIQQFRESKIDQEISYIQQMEIVGMTVNGCAKYSSYLKKLNAPIMVLEEAAEVLESQNIVILTKNLQHLILIGDHQQLRPKVQTYDLEKNYNYNLSLFERYFLYFNIALRLILNKVQFETLNIQRRMRPEFADFIRLFYGESYKDSSELKTLENVKGISSNIYFIDHKIYENSYKETNSKLNEHEVQFLIRLAKYLVQQGYQANQITILTLYVGQALNFKKCLRTEQLQNIKVATVDNYQGEENDIILLSLVRSNKELNLGFAKNSNRIIVSLSRARFGFYAIGNFSCLANGKGGEKWRQVVNLAMQKQILGNKLKLCCQNHKKESYVETIDDFIKVPEGGCEEICDVRKPCGHICKLHCHVNVNDHKREFCTDKCAIKYEACGHFCQKFCREQCNPDCMILLEKILLCGHKQKIACSLAIKNAQCQNPCEKTLKCGHQCKKLCYQTCQNFPCKEKIKLTLSCGHEVEIQCNEDKDNIICMKQCEAQLSCGHQCRGSCSKCFQGQIHYPCQGKCKKMLICGHACQIPCSLICEICKEDCNYRCCKAKCHKKCGLICFKCNNQCENKCAHSKCTNLCHEICNKPICNECCPKKLKCKHWCIGLCGEDCLDICRQCDPNNIIFQVFFGNEDNNQAKFYKLQCGHIFEVEGLDTFIKTQYDEQKNNAVKLFSCPYCKKLITKSSRYQQYLKQVQQDYKQIKQQLIDATLIDQKKLQKLKEVTQGILKNISKVFSKESKTFQFINKSIEYIQELESEVNQNAINDYISLKNKISLVNILYEVEYFSLIYKIDILAQTNCLNVFHKDFKQNLATLMNITLKKTFLASEEQWDLYFRKAQNLDLYQKIIKSYQPQYNQNLKTLIIKYLGELYNSKFFMDEELLKQCAQELKFALPVTKEEKVQIHKALGLQQGYYNLKFHKFLRHWFKCPNGHLYIITECGGAMEESKCPDCGAKIGGDNHTLTSGNTHTGEIDGSNYAAWSDQANINNNLFGGF